MTTSLGLGQRVWVDHDGSRAYGRIASLPPVHHGEPARFIALLDGKGTIVVCFEDREGAQWGFAATLTQTKSRPVSPLAPSGALLACNVAVTPPLSTVPANEEADDQGLEVLPGRGYPVALFELRGERCRALEFVSGSVCGSSTKAAAPSAKSLPYLTRSRATPRASRCCSMGSQLPSSAPGAARQAVGLRGSRRALVTRSA